uniref:Uncharacterized protein n=1 Tax=Ciona savignyi TaxID=51511 RepID=H2ZGM0_CIOSA
MGTSASPHSLPNHFSPHTSFLTGANHPANQGPSTALGHKGPAFHGQQLSQSRSTPHTVGPGFMGSPSSVQTNQSTTGSSTHQTKARKSDRRKASAVAHHSATIQDNEPRRRTDSTGSASSTGSGSRKGAQALRRKGSLPGSPIGTTATRTRKDKNASAR